MRESKSISSIAQLVERWLLIHKVMGSNPAWGRNSFIDSSYSWQPRRPKESNKIMFRVRRSYKKVFAWGWIRTHDLLDEKSTLYQLSYWANMQIKVYVFKDIRFISDLCSITCLFLIALVAAGLKGHCPLVICYIELSTRSEILFILYSELSGYYLTLNDVKKQVFLPQIQWIQYFIWLK